MWRIFLFCGALLLAACAALPREPVPVEKQPIAAIPNIAGARYWADEAPDDLANMAEEITRQRSESGLGHDVTVLALSGGADNGAFGAGLLNAWSDIGTRPEFTVVTGVSTGALSAPFAFLGPDYDDDLKEMYGGFPPTAIFKLRTWLSILPRASVADVEPLEALIARFADQKMLDEIAREHRRGRRLLVQTTNLDAERPVIWDLGAVAASGAPNALDVFRKALLASASIPVGFPPVLFEVESGDQSFDEMHVDGSVVSVATVLSDWQVDMDKAATSVSGKKSGRFTIYLIRNGRIAPNPDNVDYKLTSIAARSLDTLLKAQGVNGLLSAYSAAQVRGADYFVTWIGEDFQHEHPEPFDRDYMRALYQYGYDLMKSGKAWFDKPPVLMSSDERERSLYPLLGAKPAAD